MNFVTFDMYFIKRINIITTIVHISQEILIKECFVQIACRWRRSTVSHLSLTAPRHFYYQHTWDEYLCLTPQSRLRVQSIFQGNSGSVQQKIEQRLGWQKKNRPLKFKIFWSVKESKESNIILIWISTLHRLLCFALHLGKSNSLSLSLNNGQMSFVNQNGVVLLRARRMLGVLYILTSRGGGGTKKGPVCLSFIWTFSPFSKTKNENRKEKFPSVLIVFE